LYYGHLIGVTGLGILYLTVVLLGNTIPHMATEETPISMKLTDEDRKILEWLKKKLGANTTGVFRQALRVLRDKEKAA
jgi:hypothetical protein